MITAKEQMELVEKALDDYENNCGLPTATNPCTQEELQQYFAMNRDQIEKLSGEDCGQIATRLTQYAFYIQRLHNREHSRLVWANNQINDTISTELGSFDKYMKHETKVALIKKSNAYAQSLGKIIVYAEQRIQRLNFLAASIKNLADMMLANKRSKYVKSN